MDSSDKVVTDNMNVGLFKNINDMIISDKYGVLRKKTFYAMIRRVKSRKMNRNNKRFARSISRSRA